MLALQHGYVPSIIVMIRPTLKFILIENSHKDVCIYFLLEFDLQLFFFCKISMKSTHNVPLKIFRYTYLDRRDYSDVDVYVIADLLIRR